MFFTGPEWLFLSEVGGGRIKVPSQEMRSSERLRPELDNVLLIMKKLTGLPLIDFILSRESANIGAIKKMCASISAGIKNGWCDLVSTNFPGLFTASGECYKL